ncbi:MAG: hypothetical protein IJJ43_06380 [Oscillospiraceae bacterium]|nr:hypothetical protein [Oscillospiraceae bacterium]MBQ6465875.1 hypothetical protein [Oscillospiraceae bacterium]
MQMKILFAGAIFLGGWLYAYFFIRQILFNLQTAYPTIRKMRAADPELIGAGAMKYTLISMVVCSFFLLVFGFVVIRFCKLYLLISFFSGALIATLLLISRTRVENRAMFDAFCGTYYRFVPDDELRTAMFNKDPGKIKQRLYNMDLKRDMVPDFKKED